jgi:hypothetical protein
MATLTSHFEENDSMFKLPLPIVKRKDNIILAIYTAPFVMFLMRANPLQGQVGGGGMGFALGRSCRQMHVELLGNQDMSYLV